RLHHQFLMIVDAVDRQRIDVATRGPEHDQGTILLTDLAFKTEDRGEADLGHAAAANGRDTSAAKMLERDALAVGADDLHDRRARNCEMLAGDRHRQSGNDGQSEWNTQRHARAFAGLAVDLDDATDPLDVRPDDVHADAAARDRSDLLSRRQT